MVRKAGDAALAAVAAFSGDTEPRTAQNVLE